MTSSLIAVMHQNNTASEHLPTSSVFQRYGHVSLQINSGGAPDLVASVYMNGEYDIESCDTIGFYSLQMSCLIFPVVISYP